MIFCLILPLGLALLYYVEPATESKKQLALFGGIAYMAFCFIWLVTQYFISKCDACTIIDENKFRSMRRNYRNCTIEWSELNQVVYPFGAGDCFKLVAGYNQVIIKRDIFQSEREFMTFLASHASTSTTWKDGVGNEKYPSLPYGMLRDELRKAGRM